MSFVFLSHANEDKPRIRPIVLALLEAGYKVFLDNPDRAGFSADTPGLTRLYYDQPWEAQLHEALRKSYCVLVCWSKQAADPDVWRGDGRRVWMDEVGYARASQKAVNCVVDDVEPSELPGTYSNDNLCYLDTDHQDDRWKAALDQLLQDIGRVIDQQRRGDPAIRGARSDLDLPLLANRGHQSDLFYSMITSAEYGGVYPVVLKGPRNELPSKFVDRMERSSMRIRSDNTAWFRQRVDWPKHARSPEEFAGHYRDQLWRKLQLVPGPNERPTPDVKDRLIADHLAKRGLSAILHNFDPKNWRRREEPAFIQAWMDYWYALARLNDQVSAIPILLLPLPNAKPGWKDYPRGRTGGRAGIKDIWNAIRKISLESNSEDKTLKFPPVLAPIEQQHAENWFEDHFRSFETEDRDKVHRKIEEIYEDRKAQKHGVPHEDFYDRMRAVCAEISASNST